MRYLKYLALLGVFLIPMHYAQAQVSVGVGVGGPGYAAQVYTGPDYGPAYVDPYYGAAPVCEWGYYSYYPYACAPYGYYGPSWFSGGIFIGAGPWFGRGFYGRPGFRSFGRDGGFRSFDNQGGFRSFDNRGGSRSFNGQRGAVGGFRGGAVAPSRGFSGGNARGFSGGSVRGGGGFSGGSVRGGGSFRGGSSARSGGGGSHGGGGGSHGGGHR